MRDVLKDMHRDVPPNVILNLPFINHIAICMNNIFRAIIGGGYDYFFTYDSDPIAPYVVILFFAWAFERAPRNAAGSRIPTGSLMGLFFFRMVIDTASRE